MTPATQNFVLHFGEMGSRWGISRTVGQIYALLFVSPRPLNADDLVAALGFSRSAVGLGVKELSSWNLVRLKHLPGDRRDHYETPEDIWEIVRTLADERRKREVEPTLSLLREVLVTDPLTDDDRHAHQRMTELHDLIELFLGWHDDLARLENHHLRKLLSLGSVIGSLLDMKDRLNPTPNSGRSRSQ